MSPPYSPPHNSTSQILQLQSVMTPNSALFNFAKNIVSFPFCFNFLPVYIRLFPQQFERGHFTMQERIDLPPKNPEFKLIGRILGPRGISLRQLEAETHCKIVIRGKGSVKVRG